MSEEAKNVAVVRFSGKCPLGNCSKGNELLGKGYNDNGKEARRKVWNHVRYSPQHEYVSHECPAEADDMVTVLLDSDPGAWLVENEQRWTEAEYQQWETEGQPDEEAGTIPEPKGKPRSGGGGGGRSKSAAPKKRAQSSSSRADDTGEALGAKLEEQIRRQTKNMLHFTRASATCMQALAVAGSMARDAARTFDEQRVQLQRGVEEMIDAFGIEPPSKRTKSRHMEISDVDAIDLVRHVQRDKTSDRDRDRNRDRDR